MKVLATLCAAGLLALTAQAVAAATLSPINTCFTGAGDTSFSKRGIAIGCHGRFTGDIDSTGIGHIVTVSFTPGSALCGVINTKNLPWNTTASTAISGGGGTASIAGVAVNTAFGNCGPSTVPISIDKGGQITISKATLPGGCTVTATIQTTPPISVTP
ncbi:MAG: hypothetical protein P4L64_05390 [Caulobacteraceae bacterium]|nr:hypothetical protein [Caulobacteraceae bacterium]